MRRRLAWYGRGEDLTFFDAASLQLFHHVRFDLPGILSREWILGDGGLDTHLISSCLLYCLKHLACSVISGNKWPDCYPCLGRVQHVWRYLITG